MKVDINNLMKLADEATPGPYDENVQDLVRAIRGDFAVPLLEMRVPYGDHVTRTGRRSHKRDAEAFAQQYKNRHYFAALAPEVIKALCEVVVKAKRFVAHEKEGIRLVGDACDSFPELKKALTPFQESGQ